MPQTSSAFNACDAVVRLQDENGTLVDVSGSSNEVTIDFDNEVGDYKSFGSRWKGRIVCGSDATFKLKIILSTAASEAYDIWKSWFFGNHDERRRIQVNFPDENTGSDRFEALCVLESASGLGGPADTATPIMLDLTLLPHNGVAHQTIGS